MSDMNLEKLLDELGNEPGVEIDWSAPESGQFPPIAAPGTYEFVFHLREDEPFGSIEIPKNSGQKHLSVVFDADVIVKGEAKRLTYQRVNTFKSPKAPSGTLHAVAELARSLNLRPASNPPSNREWVETFQAASGNARGRGEIAWRFFDKATGTTFSTSPRKRTIDGVTKRDTAWPRNADGTFSDTVTASDGTKHYGQAEFIRYFSPAASAEAATA